MESDQGDGVSSHVTKGELCASIGHAPFTETLDIFSVPPSSRADDSLPAKLAGAVFEGEVGNGLRRRVLDAFALNGPMTDETLERLPAFAKCAPSTVRKRRSELTHMVPPRLVEYGTMTNSRGVLMTIWAIAP